MIRVSRVLPADHRASAADGIVVLDYDLRRRRRIVLYGEHGDEFLLDLPEATVLRDGDWLVLEDGRTVAVKSAPEPLAEISAGDPVVLARLAWHVGNRHLQAAILPGRLLIHRDHVIEEMVRGLGATVRHVDEPFEPEGGAYSHGHAHTGAGEHDPDRGGHDHQDAEDDTAGDDHGHSHG